LAADYRPSPPFFVLFVDGFGLLFWFTVVSVLFLSWVAKTQIITDSCGGKHPIHHLGPKMMIAFIITL